MIFVTVGTMFPFNRLVEAVDQWAAGSGYPDVLMQIGAGSYVPAHTRHGRIMRPSEFRDAICNCALVVTHVGMGSIIAAMEAQKPAVLFPRQLSLGEHTSDHQLHATDWVRGLPGVWIADNTTDLHRLLNEFVQGTIVLPIDAVSRHASPELIGNVAKFIRTGLSA